MPELKVFALKKLDMIVDEFWPEISEAIEKMYVGKNQKIYIYIIYYYYYNIFSNALFAVRFCMKINYFNNMSWLL